MKKLTISEKKKMTIDWGNALKSYTIYKPLQLIKRNGPVLTGIYLRPVYSGEHYVPVFHTHSLMTSFPNISLFSPVFLKNKKGVQESISYPRHSSEFASILTEFKEQATLAFSDTISCKELDHFYQDIIDTAIDYPVHTMTDSILLLFWCDFDLNLIDQRIKYYKSIIKNWPEEAKYRFHGEDGWEKEVRSFMSLKKLKGNINNELTKFKLNDIADFGLECD